MPEAIPFVTASAALADAGAQLVVVDAKPVDASILAGALHVDARRLAALVRSTRTPLIVAGRGYDDAEMARRLARWQHDDSDARLVRGGQPALVLRSAEPLSDEALATMLAVDALHQVVLTRRPGWTLLALDEAVLPEGVAASRIDGTLDRTVQALLHSASAGVVLVDESGSAAKAEAVRLSRGLGVPVFHVSGGAERLRWAFARSEAIDRRPGDNDEAGRCGS
jgi:hypothetical protein